MGKGQEVREDCWRCGAGASLEDVPRRADAETPIWAKTTIYGALGYFVSPIDAIPDVTPIVGYSDDLGVLVLALATVSAYVKDEHVTKAKETLLRWFS